MSGQRVTILSCSLCADSRSRQLARGAARLVDAAGDTATIIDPRDVALPPFDDDRCFSHPAYPALHRAVTEADGVIIAAPVYNWGLGGATRAVIELTGATSEAGLGPAWFDKVVTFLCAGGLPHSYMAYGATAMSLMLDFKCIVNPYVVHATERDWRDDGALSAALNARLAKAVGVHRELAAALRHRGYRSEWEI